MWKIHKARTKDIEVEVIRTRGITSRCPEVVRQRVAADRAVSWVARDDNEHGGLVSSKTWMGPAWKHRGHRSEIV